tara:strand:+ start:305 stop:907 length:603 start_codon:yes stop_codon:yes gene_type:complete
MKEYKLDNDTFMGAWFIDDKVCDEVIQYFKERKELGKTKPGTITQKNGGPEVKKETKDSEDFYCDFYNDSSVVKRLVNYQKNLHECMNLYRKKYPSTENISEYGIHEPFNIQHYKPGGGFKKYHFERNAEAPTNKRIFVFMTYLNNLKEGGTEWKHQKLKLPAKKGLTVIWPSDWTHTHRGVISKKEEKYIITGWYSYVK